MDSAIINLVIKGDTLVPATDRDISLLKLYNSRIGEGAKLIGFLDKSDSEKSLGHLAKIHKLIRELSLHTGYTVSELKKLVKKESGLCITTGEDEIYTSFANCTKDELGLAIQACIEIGLKVDYYAY